MGHINVPTRKKPTDYSDPRIFPLPLHLIFDRLTVSAKIMVNFGVHIRARAEGCALAEVGALPGAFFLVLHVILKGFNGSSLRN